MATDMLDPNTVPSSPIGGLITKPSAPVPATPAVLTVELQVENGLHIENPEFRTEGQVKYLKYSPRFYKTQRTLSHFGPRLILKKTDEHGVQATVEKVVVITQTTGKVEITLQDVEPINANEICL